MFDHFLHTHTEKTRAQFWSLFFLVLLTQVRIAVFC